MRFNGNDYIEYVIKERFKRDYLLKDLLDDEKEGNTGGRTVINIKFKTQDNGVLIFVVGQTGYTMLKVGIECIYRNMNSSWIHVLRLKLLVFFSVFQIKDRKPVYVSKDTMSGHLSEFTVESPVTDGVWHVLTLFSIGQNTFLLLDSKSVFNTTESTMDLTPFSVEKIVFGAALTGDSKPQQSGKYTVMCETDIKRPQMYRSCSFIFK